ncbi:MAG: NAD(P)H-dependent oxidoreductase [Desulfobacterales bacterium]|jgi:multimeric flavodoxin WrbA|nr:NAD(P)H-dependent oxidoreductase [Deltaproteobacteria bacterium]
MLVLGFQGSPRRKGNTSFLLGTFMQAAEKLGAQTQIVEVTRKDIIPCKELVVCEKKGYCPIEDDVETEIYPLIRQAEVVVLATPIFFFNMTAQLKAVVDRCQLFWARKYRFNLADPAKKTKRGFLLSVGASKGKSLFDGLQLTAKYFYDAIDAHFAGSLTYREVEGPKDMSRHPTVTADVEKAAADLIGPLIGRKKILFACRENACRSQMAGAIAQSLAGDKFEVLTGGSQPAEKIDPDMVKAMQEKGLDMAFRTPQHLKSAIANTPPEIIVTMGCGEECPFVPGAQVLDWDLPDPAGKPLDFMRQTRDEIENRVKTLIDEHL